MKMHRTLLSALALILIAFSAAAADPAVTLIYSEESPEATTRARAMKKFIELVAEKSEGSITIEGYYSGSLGPAREALEAMQTGGTVDIVVTIEPLSYWCEDVNVLSVPFLFKDEDHVDAFIKSSVGEEFMNTMRETGGVRALTYMPTDARVITANKPLRTLDDLKGLVIRVPETLTGPLAFEAMGCKVTTMAFSEVFSALQQRVIEAQENPLVFMMTSSFYEVQSHASLTNHSITVPFVFISEATYAKLTPNQQKILYECAEQTRLYEKEIRLELLEEAKTFLKDKGTVIIEDPDREGMAKAVASAYPNYPEVIRTWIQKIQAVPY